jgi:phage antirepressor YoqD-like protein
MMIMTNTTDLAAQLDTTPRTLRKFLRAEGMGVGKGSRYTLPSTKRDIARLTTRFNEWNDARTASDDD